MLAYLYMYSVPLHVQHTSTCIAYLYRYSVPLSFMAKKQCSEAQNQLPVFCPVVLFQMRLAHLLSAAGRWFVNTTPCPR